MTTPAPPPNSKSQRKLLIQRRIAREILAGRSFTSSEVTDCGELSFDDSHLPNSTNNTIGRLIRHLSDKGVIEAIGFAPSCTPTRKGGLIRRWRGTADGIEWAREMLADQGPRS